MCFGVLRIREKKKSTLRDGRVLFAVWGGGDYDLSR